MIIGITGTNGAGKGTVVEYLVQKGFVHCSAREAIVAEIEKQGLPVDRLSMNKIGIELRQKHGPSYIAEYYIARAKEKGIADIAIESIRIPEEVDYIKAHGGVMLVVDADMHSRYARIMERKSATDQVTFEEFKAQEDMEMTSRNANDPAHQDVGRVMAMADYTLHNDGTLEELHAQIDAVLEKIA